MQIERRALYNLMRMNWLLDPDMPAEAWQVEDYRSLPLTTLFERLDAHDIHLDKTTFVAYALDADTPEEFVEQLLADVEETAITQDQVYLLVFELWRRLVPEKPSLSIFCDELDHQIYLYDSGTAENIEQIQDAIANLQVILDENADQGVDPVQVFESISSGCANDIESFLYDYISDQVDHNFEVYSYDLLDGFTNYIKDVKWFDFLRARLLASSDPEGANVLVRHLVDLYANEKDLEFNLEVLSFMIKSGDRDVFINLVQKTLPLINREEDFQDLLSICADFYRLLDLENVEQAIQKIIRKRSHLHAEGAVSNKDPHFAELVAIIK